MRVLVTGASGYIGSILCGELLKAGHKVTALDNFRYRQFALGEYCGNHDFVLVRGDCRDRATIKPLVDKANVIIPLAAIVGAPACDRDRDAAISTNLVAIQLLLALKSKDQRLLIPITNSSYGVGGSEPCTEDSPLFPISLYAKTKVEAEKAALAKENTVAFRLATCFGMSPRPRMDLLVNDFVNRAMRDKSICVFEGKARRNYLHVRDACGVFLYALDHFDAMKGRPYNVGLPDANLTKLQLCEKIKEHIPELVYWEAPIGKDPDSRDYLVNNDRILSTGWTPKYSLDDGIRELIKGYAILQGERYGNV